MIDTHVHLGVSKFTGVETNESDIISAMDKYGITASFVMPQPTLDIISDVHKRIFEFSQKHPNKIYGMVSEDPWLEDSLYIEEVRKCVEEYKFVALKLHPLGHNISPLSPKCEKIYQLARKYNIPVLVHTGVGNPFSLPSLVIDPARRYPDVKFILAHAGFAVYTDEAVVAAKTCENIYLEPSWCQTYAVQKMINQVGIDRIIMGSDHLTNLPVELAKYHSINLSDQDLQKIFLENPQRIFNLKSLT